MSSVSGGDPGRVTFDGASSGFLGFGGDAIPVSRPSSYAGAYTSGVIPVSDLRTPAPPSPSAVSRREGILTRVAQSLGGDVRVAAAILSQAIQRGVDPILALAVGAQESGLHNGLRSSAGALGAMQVMPGTACGMGVCNASVVRYNPQTNAALGTEYLKAMIARYGGNVSLALAAYNAGPGAVGNHIPRIPETQNYVRSVLSYYRRFYSAAFGGYSI